jgi:glycosyltransferase involved in cell wall biosynthesis
VTAAPARRPRILMVGRTRYRLPVGPGLQRKYAALEELLDVRQLARAEPGSPCDDGRFRLLAPARPRALDGILFPFRLMRLIRREARELPPDAILAQGPYEAAVALAARTRAKVLVEIHGDWRAGTRLYGSRARRALSPLADALAAWAVRRAHGVRTLSPFTTALVRALGVEPAAVFPAYVDFEPFLASAPTPLPERPRALFVGVLERYKNVDGLARAWRRVEERLPAAELVVVGTGSLAAMIGGLGVTWKQRLTAREVAAELDAATVLFLPSASEGLPRVVVEAFCRGRPVVAARAGGIPDIVAHDRNGLLADDVDGLADALVRVLEDRVLAERLATGARASAADWIADPEEFAARVAAFVQQV